MASASSAPSSDLRYQGVNVRHTFLNASQLIRLLPYIQHLIQTANDPALRLVAAQLKVDKNSIAGCTSTDDLHKISQMVSKAFDQIVYIPMRYGRGVENIPVMEFQVSGQSMKALYHTFPENGFELAMQVIAKHLPHV